jgi:putative N6-adenine-specific DNA methylase
MNPEYGSRMGEIEKLETEYKRIGDFLKQRCAGYTAYILVGNKELSAKIRLKASRRMVFYNGKIECRLLKYELYKGIKPPQNSK